MMMTRCRKQTGFTLIELMVVIAIVGILAAVAYPAYLESVNKSRRADAKATMATMAQQLERCFTQYNRYKDKDCSVTDKDEKYYTEKPAGDSETIQLTEKYINQFQRSDKELFELLHQYNRRTEGEVVRMDYNTQKAVEEQPKTEEEE